MKKFYSILFLCYFAFTQAQTDSNTLDFKLLRQYDNINITQKENLYHHSKSISLGDSVNLSLGGSYRFQTESFIHAGFVEVENPNEYWFLHRAMLHANLNVGSKLQVFAELNSSTVSNKLDVSPVDEDELYLNQLFAKYNLNKNWHFLLGRQNMRLGSGRLIDLREGPNVRLSFDMAEVQYQNDNMSIKGFYAIPLQSKPGAFDNNSMDTAETLSAIYWTQKWAENTHTDLYVFHKKEANKTWTAEAADDRRTSIGVRTFGQWNEINYNNEFVYQLGKFGDKDIYAWTVSIILEKEFNKQNPFTLGIKTEAISGDDATDDNVVNTFDALYPRGAHFGRVAYFGPSNLIDIHPYFTKSFGNFSLELDYEAFWRFSTNDGLYNPSLKLEFPSDNNKKFIAHQFGIYGGYTLNKFITLELESNLISPGEFFKYSGKDKTLSHFVFTTNIQF